MAAQTYKDISAIARQRRHDALAGEAKLSASQLRDLPKDVTHISRDLKVFSQDEIEIINSEPEDILLKISERIWTALEVTEAFCKSAAIAQQLINAVTEVLFVEARAQAKALDDALENTGKLVGPLHGLPISLKDCFVTPPHPSTIGIAAFANETTTPDQESIIVDLLRSLGAVAYVKTNTPVGMMMCETDNNVFGPTRNPHNTTLSAGGSSGGEGALIALHASPLGVGTDIGGSVRIPAAWCNLYGLRPSAGRFPTFGTRSGIPGQEFILSVNGPMARTLESIDLYCAALLSPAAAPWRLDPKCVAIPWQTGPQILPAGRKLRFAIVGKDDGMVTAHPPVERALGLTFAALRGAGHEVVPWDTSLHQPLYKMLGAAFLDYGGSAMMPLLESTGEPVFTSMEPYAVAYEAAKAAGGTGLTPDQQRANNLAKWKLQKAYLDAWQAADIDGIIMAVSPWSAPRLGFTHAAPGNHYVGYTGWVNVLDLPACSFPVMRADKGLDPLRKDFQPLNAIDAQIQADYEPDFYDGSPVALQLVGERLQEEKVLEMVRIVRDALTATDGVIR